MILRIWFGLVNVVLITALAILLYNFNLLSIFHWIAFLALVWGLGLSIFVYLEKPHKQDLKLIQKEYEQFLRRKDKQIEELQSKSDVLFKTAFKRSEHEMELNELKKKLEQKD